MSNRPQPTQKQMILQQLMLAAAVFLGLQLMCNRPQGPQDTRPPSQVFGNVEQPMEGSPPTPKEGEQWDLSKGTLAWANSKLRWVTANSISSNYQGKLKDEIKNEKDPSKKADLEAHLEEKQLYADILAVDAHYKYVMQNGEARADANALRPIYLSIQNWKNKYGDTPLWTEEFKVPPAAVQPERFPWTSWTPKQFTETVSTQLAAKSKDALVYGLIPGYKIVDGLVHLTGAVPGFSYAFAAFLLAIFVRALIFPLAQKQLLWGRKMQQLAPLVKEIKEQYTDKKTKQVTNQVELQQKTMALYQEYGINPLAGCLPAFIQFPLFITVYQFMLNYQFSFERGTFLWVSPSGHALTHFFAPNLGQRDTLMIILYGITMISSTLLMPVSDPSQAKQQKLMGVGMGLLFTFMMFTGTFPAPAAFVLYWVFTNLLATSQSLWVYRMPMPPLQKVNTKPGGVFPMSPFMPKTDPQPKNGKTNGKSNGTMTTNPTKTTGTPAKHKPKKRK